MARPKRKQPTATELRLREICRLKGFQGLPELAQAIGYELHAVWKWAYRDAISKEGARAIAERLNVPLPWILSLPAADGPRSTGDVSYHRAASRARMVAEAVYEFVKDEDLTAEDFGIVVESIIRAVPDGGRPAPETVKAAIRTVVTKRREPGARKPGPKKR